MKRNTRMAAKAALTLVLALALCLGMTATVWAAPNSGGNANPSKENAGTAETPAQAAITKILKMPLTTTTPELTFTFDVKPVAYNDEATPTALAMMPKIGAEGTRSVTFDPDLDYGEYDLTWEYADNNPDKWEAADPDPTTKVLYQEANIFADVEFKSEGEYHYHITEQFNTGATYQPAIPGTEEIIYSLASYDILAYVAKDAATNEFYIKYIVTRKGTPGTPGTSGTPDVPGTPGTPGTSGTPGTPGIPGEPKGDKVDGTPATPGTPGTEGKPGNPYKPGQPGQPGTGATPGIPGEYSQIIFENIFTRRTGPGTEDPKTSDNLTVSKEVKEELAPTTKFFAFQMTVTQPAIITAPQTYRAYIMAGPVGLESKNVLNEETADDYGVTIANTDALYGAYVDVTAGTPLTFNLKHGERLVVVDAHVGASYVLNEGANNGWTPSYLRTINGSTAEGVRNGKINEGLGFTDPCYLYEGANGTAYTNLWKDTLPTGLSVNDLPFVTMLVLAGAALVGAVVLRYRKKVGAK